MTSLSLSPRDQVHETHSIEAGCDAFVKQPGRWRVGKTRACRKPEGNKHCAVGAAAQLVLVFVLAAPHKLRVPSPRHQGQGPIARGRQTPQAATGLPVLDLVAGHLDGPRGAREDLALKPAQLQRDVRAHDGQPGFGNRPFQADFTEPGSVFQVVGHQAGGCVQPGDGVGDVDDQRGAAAVRGHATFDGCTRQHRHHVGLGGVHFAGARAVAQQQHRFGKHGVGVVCVFLSRGRRRRRRRRRNGREGHQDPAGTGAGQQGGHWRREDQVRHAVPQLDCGVQPHTASSQGGAGQGRPGTSAGVVSQLRRQPAQGLVGVGEGRPLLPDFFGRVPSWRDHLARLQHR